MPGPTDREEEGPCDIWLRPGGFPSDHQAARTADLHAHLDAEHQEKSIQPVELNIYDLGFEGGKSEI